MSKSILNGSEIRAAVGVDNLKTIRHEYKVLELVNSLYEQVYGMECCDYESGITTEELAMLGSKLGDLLRIVSDDYGMVCAKDKENPKYKSHFRTFKGEHDEWKEISND
jgi:hypothetical protein|tara:strand:+ start:409 stop:735 length:327 start_codon:yes stop_codon:yes gene_type:complete